MENTKFKNLNDFFNYVEFCPICKSRLDDEIIFLASNCHMGSKDIIIKDLLNMEPWKDAEYKVNLFSNAISSNYLNSRFPEHADLHLAKRCGKYHFMYTGVVRLHKEKLLAFDVFFKKYHFIRIHGTTHFSVNGNLENGLTSITITRNNFRTTEISSPFINFDFSSKRKIDKKLRNIQLLA